jgi:hypothetical protein
MSDEPLQDDLDEYIKTIGLLVVRASSFDYQLAGLLSECFSLTAVQENVLLRPLGTRAKVDMLQRLSKFIESSQHKEICKWCQSVKDHFDERNTVVHGVPGMWEGKITLRLYSAAKAFTGRGEEWPLARVSELGTKINDLGVQLDTFIRPAFEQWIEASARYLAEDFAPSRAPRR